MKCYNCGKDVKETDKFCGWCGSQVLEEESIKEMGDSMHCHICNSMIQKNDKVCSSCGAILNVNDKGVDIITSSANEGYFVKGHISHAPIWFSIVALLVSFMLSSFGMILPIITGVVSLGALGFAIYKFVRIRHRLNIWAIGISVLAILVSGVGITNELIEKDYAYERPNIIGELINVEFPDVAPSFYEISIMDGVLVKSTFLEYASNEIILKPTDEQANEFIIKYENRFTNLDQETFEDYFSDLVLDENYVSIVYDLKNNTLGFPVNMEDYDLIIINYYLDKDLIQILEITKWSI